MEEKTIYSLLVDDEVILEEDEQDVSYMFRKLVEYENWRLEINLRKTEYMVIGSPEHDVDTNKEIIKNASQYKYLGVTLTSYGKDELDI